MMKKIALIFILLAGLIFIISMEARAEGSEGHKSKHSKHTKHAPVQKTSKGKRVIDKNTGKKAHKISDKKSPLGAKLATDHTFDNLSVNGRYQSAFEGVATVENEKQLQDLLDYRTNYDDRIRHSQTQF
jgi:hypothetical protein